MAMFITLCSFGQTTPQTNEVIPTENTAQTNQIKEQYPPTATIATYRTDLDRKYEDERPAVNKCEAYHRMKIAGIVLSAVGGGMIITGAVLTATANPAYVNGSITYDDYVARTRAGTAVLGVGIAALGAGIPLAIIGSIKTNKYCRGGRATLNLQSGNNGTGLAVVF